MPRSAPRHALAALALAVALSVPAARAAEGDPPAIDPIATDEAAAQAARGARLLVTVGPAGELRASVRGTSTGTVEPPIKADDPAVRAVLTMLGLDRPARFAIVGVQNPQCIRICELIGGDYVCRKVCN